MTLTGYHPTHSLNGVVSKEEEALAIAFALMQRTMHLDRSSRPRTPIQSSSGVLASLMGLGSTRFSLIGHIHIQVGMKIAKSPHKSMVKAWDAGFTFIEKDGIFTPERQVRS